MPHVIGQKNIKIALPVSYFSNKPHLRMLLPGHPQLPLQFYSHDRKALKEIRVIITSEQIMQLYNLILRVYNLLAMLDMPAINVAVIGR